MRVSRALMILLLGAVVARAQDGSDAARVQADVRRVARAVYDGDVETILRFSHPAILQIMGGPEQARRVLQDLTRQFQAMGMTQESFSFPETPRFLRGNKRLFALVATRAIVATKGKRIESWNFQLGIREDGSAQWTYFEGSRLTDEVRESLFPDLPKAFERPKVSRKAL